MSPLLKTYSKGCHYIIFVLVVDEVTVVASCKRRSASSIFLTRHLRSLEEECDVSFVKCIRKARGLFDDIRNTKYVLFFHKMRVLNSVSLWCDHMCNFVFTTLNAFIAVSICSGVCAEVIVMRRRLVPFGTVGGRMAGT